MIKKIYGFTNKNEKIELDFKKFLMITDNDSHLIMDIGDQKHPEDPDLLLHIELDPPPDTLEKGTCSLSTAEHKYFSILPGASNTVYIKTVRREQIKNIKK